MRRMGATRLGKRDLGRLSILLGAVVAMMTGCEGSTRIADETDVPWDALVGDADPGPDVARCDPVRQVEPASRDDVVYAEWGAVACLEEPCLCSGTGAAASTFVEKLLGCEAVIGGYFWSFGSAVIQVMGRQDDRCVIEIREEVEGGVGRTECRIPFPLSPWPGLATDGDTMDDGVTLTSGIEAYCQPAGSCCVLEGCPSPCDASTPMCGDLPGWFSYCDQ